VKVLAVSDKRHRALYDYFDRERWKDIDIVISCGDIDARYLSFLVTMIPKPLLYVPGNHDQAYLKNPPEGCDSVDGKVVVFQGTRIGGLGGCYWYNGKDLQYTERQMSQRVRKLIRGAKRMGGLDILVTHAPPDGVHDLPDMCHRGFRAFLTIIDELKPRVLVHGHNHEVYSVEDRETTIHGTRIINAFEYCCFEIDG
jgi:Icc-related predicted phosphoesterase